MQQCTVFALFSASEGCPTVVIEALTLGCPVIVTDVNGVDELIDNGRTGLIVPNEMSAMAAGLTDHVWSLREWITCPAVERQ